MSVLIAALLVASTALAKGDKKKKADAPAAPKAGLMEEGSKDPAETESADDGGQFVPGKKKTAPGHVEGEGDDESGTDVASDGDASKKDKAPEPEKKDKPIKARKTIGVFAEALIGFGNAPEPGSASSASPGTSCTGGSACTGKATSYGFLLGGHYDITTELRAMLRIPWTTASILNQGGQSTSQAAFGAPEIAARYRLTEPGTSEWAVRLAVGIPIAQGNSDVTNTKDLSGWEQGRVQRVADAADGWHDPELYAPKRIPISPALLFTSRMDKLKLGAELKVVVMPKVGGNIALPNSTTGNGGTYELNATAFAGVIGGSASYEVLEHTFLALSAWATYVSPGVDYTSTATAPTPFQFVLEPKILAQFGHVVPSVGFLLPIGGQLGGQINGIRIHVDAVF